MRFFVTMSLLMCVISMAYGQKNNNERRLTVGSKTFIHKARTATVSADDLDKSSNNCTSSPYRTIDGTCNNQSDTIKCFWGATDIQLRRALPSDYAFGIDELAGANRLSPRAISNLVSNQTESIENARNLSSLVFTWGQFLDHDLDLTPEGEESANIPLPADEPLFAMDIPFHRALTHENTGVTTPREHSNIITSWIDASNVYGSEIDRANWLRTFVDGKLKTSAGNLLPYNTTDGELGSPIDILAPSMAGDHFQTAKVFVAGDVRANEQPGLTSLHTLFVREHNRICDELLASGMTDDELMYQTARKRVGAYMQAITYQEFLPALGIELNPYTTYDPNVQPDISSIFSTAAYRLGHTMVTMEIPLKDDDCVNIAGGSLSLFEGFFEPSHIASLDIDPFLKGLSSQVQQEVDTKVIDNLRNFLFGNDPNATVNFGLDLVALNIQRGRDHGLPDYNTIRTHFTGQAVQSFADITHDEDLQLALQTAYGSVNDIDAWVGMLAEDHLPNSSVGMTLHAVLQDQFERLRDGDYFYYEYDSNLSTTELAEINTTTFSDIVARNTGLTTLQSNVFFAIDCACQMTAGTPCDDGNVNTINDVMDNACNCMGTQDSMAVTLRAYLSGAMLNSTDDLMNNDLHDNNYLPMLEPYSSLPGFTHVTGGGEMMDPSLLSLSGTDGLVDWVYVEVRDVQDPSIVLATQTALIQCDGDIVSADGSEVLTFPLVQDYYHIAIRHRNHLGVMCADPSFLNMDNPPMIDFSAPDMVTWGDNAQFTMTNGKMGMWAGNVNGDDQIIFQGPDNEPNQVFFDILNDPANTNNFVNFIKTGYNLEDVDMDGQTIYQGGSNENNPVFLNIMLHPENFTNLNNYVIQQQLP